MSCRGASILIDSSQAVEPFVGWTHCAIWQVCPKDSSGSYRARSPRLLQEVLSPGPCVGCDLLCESEVSWLQGIQRDPHKPTLTISQSAPNYALYDSQTAHKITHRSLSLALETGPGLAPSLPPSLVFCCFFSCICSMTAPTSWL